MTDEETKRIKLKPYSPADLAEIYDVDPRTFKRWIAPFEEAIGERQGRYYTIKQVKVIFDKISLPGYVVLE
jgi:hypothetical protein